MKFRFLIVVLALSAASPLPAQLEIDEATARLEMARVLRDSGKLTEAIAAYRLLAEQDAANRAASGELAEVLVWNKETEAAAKVLAAIPEEEWTPNALSAAAELDVQSGRFDQAEKRLRQLIAKDPAAAFQVRLASVLSWKKDYSGSLVIFAEMVGKNPADVQLRRKYAQVLGWAGRPEEAAEQWRLSLVPQP